MEALFLALTGTLAGVAHALSGPDHLAAVLPLTAEAPRRAVRTTLAWAAGHGTGTLALAAVAGLLRGGLPLDALGAHAEAVIGVVLVATGAWSLARSRRERAPSRDDIQPSREGGSLLDAGAVTRPVGLALAFGGLHGIAGGTHVVTVLAALALPTEGAIAWLSGFVAGAGLAMGAVGVLARTFGGTLPPARLRTLQRFAATLAMIVGVAWTVLAVTV